MKERGVALVIVLGVVALVSAWAATAAYEDMISLRRAENLQESSRAWLANESALSVVRYVLSEDSRLNSVDNLDEPWAEAVPPMPVDDGLVMVTIIDANRYFNLNDLVSASGVVELQAVKIVRAVFLRLELQPSLVEKLLDWLDRDDQVRAGGGEDDSYFDRPYRVKNARLDRWQELSLIAGFDAEVMAKLKTMFTVRRVPSTGNSRGKTPMNINTMDRVLLMAIFPKMGEAAAETFIQGRPYLDIASAVDNRDWRINDNTRLSVASDGFIVRTDALFGRARWREEQLLTRGSNGATTVEYRERLGWVQ